jgi:hypothetical protein
MNENVRHLNEKDNFKCRRLSMVFHSDQQGATGDIGGNLEGPNYQTNLIRDKEIIKQEQSTRHTTPLRTSIKQKCCEISF